MLLDVEAREELKQARQAFRQARYDDALELLKGSAEWSEPELEEATLLGIDILNRRDPVGAVEELARHRDVFVTREGLIGYHLTATRAYANIRDYKSAEGMADEARRLAVHAGPGWREKIDFELARTHYLSGHYDPEDIALTLSLNASSPSIRVAAYSVRGWVYAALGDYEKQIEDLKSGLEIVAEFPDDTDVHMAATIIHSLLRIGFELGDPSATEAGARAYERLQWTPDVQVDRFQSVRALGWSAFLRGEPGKAQWFFTESKSLAPSPAWQVMAHLDRAYVARMESNEPWALDELHRAQQLSADVQWDATRGEERLALITLAILAAPVDLARAQRYVATYNSIGTDSIIPSLAIVRDPRASALEKYASGRVHQVLGNKQLATTMFTSAYETFDKARHHYRCALAASALFEITGEASWQHNAQRHAENFPKSSLSKSLSEPTPPVKDEVFAAMSPLRRQIAFALCHGLTPQEMSVKFSRSLFTLSRHVDEVFEHFGARSHHELRTAMLERDLLR